MSLTKTIKSYFDHSVASIFNGTSNKHPIIVLNALKNIIGDDRQNPSQCLLDAMAALAEKYPQRKDDKAVLDTLAKEGLGNTVFIADLEDACQSGDSLAMEKEAARVQWVSENGLAGLDCLIEVALQDFDRLGTFAYHLQRANIFQQDVKKTWHYSRSLLKEIVKAPLSVPHSKKDVNPELIMNTILTKRIDSPISNFAAAIRLWEGEYVRISGYRRELSHWYSKFNFDQQIEINEKGMKGLENYVKNGGNFFIQMAEELTTNQEWELQIIELEALRYFSNKVTSNKDLVDISSYLKEIIK